MAYAYSSPYYLQKDTETPARLSAHSLCISLSLLVTRCRTCRTRGKNVLNFFRQDHGYQEGTYVKLWQGREDNEHLSELLESLDDTDPGFPDAVYRALSARYPQ